MYTTDKNNQGYLEIFKLEKRNKLSTSWDWALLSTIMVPNFSICKAISSHPKPLPAALESGMYIVQRQCRRGGGKKIGPGPIWGRK